MYAYVGTVRTYACMFYLLLQSIKRILVVSLFKNAVTKFIINKFPVFCYMLIIIIIIIKRQINIINNISITFRLLFLLHLRFGEIPKSDFVLSHKNTAKKYTAKTIRHSKNAFFQRSMR